MTGDKGIYVSAPGLSLPVCMSHIRKSSLSFIIRGSFVILDNPWKENAHIRMVVPAKVMVGMRPIRSESQPNTRDPTRRPNILRAEIVIIVSSDIPLMSLPEGA